MPTTKTTPITKKTIAPKTHYVSNKDFLAAILQYKKDCWHAKRKKQPKPVIPDYVGKCLLLISDNLAHKASFRDYTYIEEMKSDGIENCIMYFDNFNAKKSKNPFAYFTQIMYYAFTRRIQKEKNQLYAKYKWYEQMGVNSEGTSTRVDEDENTRQFEMYENIGEFIEKFEKSRAKAKEKAKGVKPKKKVKLEKYIKD